MTVVELTLRFETDWHVGQGAGRPRDLDAMVRLDTDGYPYVPAKTIGPMWRDATERVAKGLDGGSTGGWSVLVVALFGSDPRDGDPTQAPTPSRVVPDPCRYSQPVKAAVERDALTFAKTEVMIDPDTRAARHDHLRTVEMVRGGSVLHGRVQVLINDWAADDTAAALALLRGGLHELTRLGGKRRRGAGRVTVTPDGSLPELSVALTRLADDAPTDLGPRSRQAAVVALDGIGGSDRGWYEADLAIELAQPLVVADRTAGNVIATRDYVPGGMLLGPVVGALPGGWQSLLADVQAGRIRVLNAYCEVDSVRGLPVPFALFYEKGTDGLEGASQAWNRLEGDPPADVQAVQHRRGYLAGEGASTRLATVTVGVRTHATIEDDVQRPTERVGGVYTYEAIEPTVTLHSKVLVDGSVLGPDDVEGFEIEGRLGTSKKDDYGRVRLVCSGFRRVEPDELSEADDPSAAGEPAEVDRSTADGPPEAEAPSETDESAAADATAKATLWLLSDLLLRSASNQPSTSLKDLARLLHDELDTQVTIEDPFVRTRRTEGWVRRWGLPRPSLVGLAAGSAMVCSFDRPVRVADLRRLEHEGLGERVAEGFGEVRFAAAVLDAGTVHTRTDGQLGVPDGERSQRPGALAGDPEAHPAPSETFLSAVKREQQRTALAMAAAAAAGDTEARRSELGWKATRPTNAQLGALRAALRTWEAFVAWWSGVKQVPNRANAWPQQARKVLDGLIADPGRICDLLGIVSEQDPGDLLRHYLEVAVRHELRDRQRQQGSGEDGDG